MTLFLPTIITITEGNMTTMIGYVGDLFTDLSPVVLLIVGVSLGLMVISVVIGSLRA